MTLPTDALILFQGDSITDAGRDRTYDVHPECRERGGLSLGSGYAMMAAAHLGIAQPTWRFRNFGISGNRIVDLEARIKEHVWNHRPAVLSILIGVNDTWHDRKRGSGVDLPRYERSYRRILADTKEQLPDLRLVLCEPFVLECGEVGPDWPPEVDQRREVVRTLAAEFGATLVPFQQVFDEAARRAPPERWLGDGVHPGPAGHLLMARAWLAAAGLG